MKWTALASLAATVSIAANANTWNEPWQEEVVTRATSFGLFRVEQAKGRDARVMRIKHLAGTATGDSVQISGYAHLEMTSASSDDWDIWLKPGQSYYLHLSPGTDGRWQVQTPSAGADLLQPDGQVQATYRISMHKALVPAPVYEKTQQCIFELAHGGGCDRTPIEAYIREHLEGGPSPLDDQPTRAQLGPFFGQHVAMETAAAMHYLPPAINVDAFVDSPAMHVHFSALKLMAATLPASDAAPRLAAFVCDEKRDRMFRGYALHLIDRRNLRGAAAPLKQCLAGLPDDSAQSALTAIMDPRVGTHFPYRLKASAEKLLGEWEATPN